MPNHRFSNCRYVKKLTHSSAVSSDFREAMEGIAPWHPSPWMQPQQTYTTVWPNAFAWLTVTCAVVCNPGESTALLWRAMNLYDRYCKARCFMGQRWNCTYYPPLNSNIKHVERSNRRRVHEMRAAITSENYYFLLADVSVVKWIILIVDWSIFTTGSLFRLARCLRDVAPSVCLYSVQVKCTLSIGN